MNLGDTIGDTMIADLTKGRAVFRLMNMLGSEAIAIGNHEPDYPLATLMDLAREAQFPLNAANLTEERGGRAGF